MLSLRARSDNKWRGSGWWRVSLDSGAGAAWQRLVGRLVAAGALPRGRACECARRRLQLCRAEALGAAAARLRSCCSGCRLAAAPGRLLRRAARSAARMQSAPFAKWGVRPSARRAAHGASGRCLRLAVRDTGDAETRGLAGAAQERPGARVHFGEAGCRGRSGGGARARRASARAASSAATSSSRGGSMRAWRRRAPRAGALRTGLHGRAAGGLRCALWARGMPVQVHPVCA